jgi:hypothetical protein
MTFVAEAHGTVTNNGVDIVLPAGLQGGDVIVASVSSLDTTIGAPAGWGPPEKQQIIGGLLHATYTKVAAGTVGSGSSEAGTTVTFNVAISGAGHKSSVALMAWRGISVSSPVNDSDMNSYTSGGQSFTGPGGSSTVDGVTVVSCFADKDSSNPLNITPPAGQGYTQRSAAVFTSGSGKANTVIATKDGGSIGTYGAEAPWTTDAIPGTVSIITLLLAPTSTIQVSRPASDVGTPTGVTGVPTNTAGSLYTNLDEPGAANLTDYVEFTLSGDLATNGTAINDPSTTSGFKVGAVLGLGAGTSSATFHYKLMRSSTVVDEWDWTVTVDNTAFTRDIDPSLIAAHVTYSSGTVTLKLDRELTAVS